MNQCVNSASHHLASFSPISLLVLQHRSQAACSSHSHVSSFLLLQCNSCVFMILLLEKSISYATLEAAFLRLMVLNKCLWSWRRVEWDHWVMKGLQELWPETILAVGSQPLKQVQWAFCLCHLQNRFKAIWDGQTTFKWKMSSISLH